MLQWNLIKIVLLSRIEKYQQLVDNGRILDIQI